jgi:hypothetical protein
VPSGERLPVHLRRARAGHACAVVSLCRVRPHLGQRLLGRAPARPRARADEPWPRRLRALHQACRGTSGAPRLQAEVASTGGGREARRAADAWGGRERVSPAAAARTHDAVGPARQPALRDQGDACGGCHGRGLLLLRGAPARVDRGDLGRHAPLARAPSCRDVLRLGAGPLETGPTHAMEAGESQRACADYSS